MEDIDKRLRREFKHIRLEFYPKWDRRRRWSVRAGTRRGCAGFCDPGRRIIGVNTISENQDELHLLLVHEIAHAVAGGAHGKHWRARMEMAAAYARKIGRERLTGLIDAELMRYLTAYTPKAADVYGQLEDCVRDAPQATYTQARSFVLRDLGLLSHEFERRFRRASRVFRAARAEVHAEQRRQQKFLGQHAAAATA